MKRIISFKNKIQDFPGGLVTKTLLSPGWDRWCLVRELDPSHHN